jgi:hypothetical protein
MREEEEALVHRSVSEETTTVILDEAEAGASGRPQEAIYTYRESSNYTKSGTTVPRVSNT